MVISNAETPPKTKIPTFADVGGEVERAGEVSWLVPTENNYCKRRGTILSASFGSITVQPVLSRKDRKNGEKEAKQISIPINQMGLVARDKIARAILTSIQGYRR